MQENMEHSTDRKLDGVDVAPGKESFKNGGKDMGSDSTSRESSTSEQNGEATSAGVDEIPSTVESSDELLNLKKQVEDLTDALRRERAEFQNYKKRIVQEQAKNRVQTIGRFVGNLITPLDNLDRVLAVKTEDPNLLGFISGVDMIRNEFLNAFAGENIKPLHPKDAPFDPFSMEAISAEEKEELTSDTVLEVYQNGYVYESGEDRFVIRPARVKVGKPKVSQQDSASNGTQVDKEA